MRPRPLSADMRLHCRARRLPEPEPEYVFGRAIGRKWRFDWAWPALMLAVEVEGIVYPKRGSGSHQLGGRHVSVKGFREDTLKYAAAFTLGWTVLRVLPEHVRSGLAAGWIEQRLLWQAQYAPRTIEEV